MSCDMYTREVGHCLYLRHVLLVMILVVILVMIGLGDVNVYKI